MALSCTERRKGIDSSKEGPAPTKTKGISSKPDPISAKSGAEAISGQISEGIALDLGGCAKVYLY